MGEDERFAVLVPGHIAAMLRAATALVGAADAEDATQEAITRAWQGWAGLRDVEALRPWLLRITVNVCRQWQRGRFGTRRRLTQALTDEALATPALLEPGPDASDLAGALDLRHAINQLPDDLRLVVLLRYYGGMDSTEIGAALAIPAGTVRSRLHRALATLREHLRSAENLPVLFDHEGGR